MNCLTDEEVAELAGWLAGVNEYLDAVDTCPLVIEWKGY